MSVLVIGGGAAGTAACWCAARAGHEVAVVYPDGGASSLYSGALDLVEWDRCGPAGPVGADLVAFAAALGTWRIGASPAVVATGAGLVRPARGVDAAVLDLVMLEGRTVAVVEVSREGWDGAALATSLAESDWARRTETRFRPVRANILLHSFERALSDFDFARLHDDPTRADWLAGQLRAASAGFDAWLLGPWLGVDGDAGERVRQATSMEVGETLSAPGGPAGARFDVARDRLLRDGDVRVHRGRGTTLRRSDGRWRLSVIPTDGLAGQILELDADAVILAIGGVVAGGIMLDDSSEAYREGTSFHLSVEAPVRFELDGRDLGAVSTLHGLELDRYGIGALERVGVATDGLAIVGAPGLFAAGSVVAGRPRTVLEAARAGIAGARAALASGGP